VSLLYPRYTQQVHYPRCIPSRCTTHGVYPDGVTHRLTSAGYPQVNLSRCYPRCKPRRCYPRCKPSRCYPLCTQQVLPVMYPAGGVPRCIPSRWCPPVYTQQVLPSGVTHPAGVTQRCYPSSRSREDESSPRGVGRSRGDESSPRYVGLLSLLLLLYTPPCSSLGSPEVNPGLILG